MYGNRASHINIYKSKLSDFGKNVFENLLIHKNQVFQNKCGRPKQSDYKNIKYKQKLSYENSLHYANTNCEVLVPQEVNYSNMQHTNISQSEDLVVPFTVGDKITNNTNNCKVYQKYNIAEDIADQNQISEFKASLEENLESIDKISWKDMFDSDIIQGANDVNTINILTQSSLFPPSPVFSIKFHKGEKNKGPIDQQNVSKTKRTKNITTISTDATDIKKPVKRLQKQTKVTETIDKRVKNVPNVNAIKHVKYRKENYNKTVQNWLKDINNDAIEGAKQNQISTTEIIFNTESNIGKENNKKVIQTRLANKDGKMKYDKPKPNNTSSEVVKSDKAEDAKEKPAEKERKRPKFTPPIKPVKPIKDVTYTVIIIDEHNFNNFDLESHNEVTLLVIYENGFNQLNEQYTETACVSEGILMQFRNSNVFYYWKQEIITNNRKINEYLTMMMSQFKIICFDGKKVLIYLTNDFNLPINTYKLNLFDIKIGGSLLDSEADLENFSQLKKLLCYDSTFTIITDCKLQKCAWYLGMLEDCSNIVLEKMCKESLQNVFIDIEMRLLPIVADMEQRGVHVDVASLKYMETILINRMKAAELKCYEAAGRRFQINSTVQVGAILYDELKLDSKINIKIQETVTKGAKSTSEPMLRSLMSVHPLPKHILQYRHLHKAYATFLTGISQHVKHGVVRPTWIQIASATGRIASANPNLQAIPKTPFALDPFPEDNKQDDQNHNVELLFRSIYVSRAGHSLLAVDFQHIECRVFAHMAKDRNLLDIFAQGGDFFKVLASKWLNKNVELVTREERERSKRMVYANLYGAGTKKLMHILDMTYDHTLSVVTSFNRTFPSLKGFGREVVARCQSQRGRVTSVSGRARTLPDVCSADLAARSHAHRQAVNFVIQGSAADICKMAMITSVHRLQTSLPAADVHLVLQIHDELVWEVADHQLEAAAVIIREAMETCGRACGVDVPLPVAMSRGSNWGQMIPIQY